MSTDFLVKALCAAIWGGAFSWRVSRCDREKDPEYGDRPKYESLIPGYMLPLCLVMLLAFSFHSFNGKKTLSFALSLSINIFPLIGLYYLLLLPVLPLLRRHIHARTCALLWIVPNFLPLTWASYMELPGPLWVLHISDRLAWYLFWIWGAGFFGILGWHVISHLMFRFRLLHGAAPLTDERSLAIWQEEAEKARLCKSGVKPVMSPAVQTPLSIGLFSWGMRVVLPKRSYDPDELALIFRHEIVHIERQDSWSKFFLVFCTAMCWFNPFMWVAMRKSADDLELSCDEAVLADSDAEGRRRYANLLLQTAGDERGFTTCLSASASALRYRLKHTVGPAKKRSGALTVGLVFFLLCMSCGYTAISYGSYTGAEVMNPSQKTDFYRLSSVWRDGGVSLVCVDEEGLDRYLSTLRMENVMGNYSFYEDGRQLRVIYDTPEGAMGVILSDHIAKVWYSWDESMDDCYYLPDGADWELLDGLFVTERVP